MTDFPQGLDTDADLTKGPSGCNVLTVRHDAVVKAVKAIEDKLGVDGSAIVETIDYILKQLAIKH